MGRVFLPEEVEGSRVPKLDSFPFIVDRLREVLADSPLLGGVICGSVGLNKHGIRSDIDCLVLYHEHDEREMVRRFSSLIKEADSLYVPLDFIDLTLEIASTSMQSVGPSLIHHARICAQRGGLIKADPFDIMIISELDHRTEAMNWTRQKVRAIREMRLKRVHPIREVYQLQKLLEAPIHGMRKLLLVSGGFKDDSKSAVMNMAEERYPALAAELRRLVALDEDYTQSLKGHLQLFEQERYQDQLDLIRNEGYAVSRFLREIGFLLEQ